MGHDTIGLIGGILGAVIGLGGGAFGTYKAIRNTAGPRERAFMIRCSAAAWVIVLAFLAGLLLIRGPERYLLWLPYGILMWWGIRAWNRRQAEIREMESGGKS